MESKKNNAAKAIVRFAKAVANVSKGSASMWSIYQPQEPKKKAK